MNNPDKTALLIEDDTDICMLLSILLSDHNYATNQAHSIKLAKELVTKASPEVIFIDHKLADGYGFDFLPELRTLFPSALIIAITAQHSAELESTAYANGASHYFEKPFQLSRIKELLEKQNFD